MSLNQDQSGQVSPPAQVADWSPVVDRINGDLRQLLESYALGHLSSTRWEVSEHPVPCYDLTGEVVAVEWSLAYNGKYSGQKSIGVTLLLRRRSWGPLDLVGFRISGTSGRSQAQPSLQDLAAALADSKPLDDPAS